MKTIYLLGAGASKDAGAPLANEILPIIKNYSEEYGEEGYSHTSKFLNEIKMKFINPFQEEIMNGLFNIEDALSLTYNRTLFEILMNLNYQRHSLALRNRLKWAIFYIIRKATWNNPNWKLYNKFVDEKINKNDVILSVNYDLVIEDALKRVYGSYNCGFPKEEATSPITLFDFSQQRKEIFEGILLLKLHGSLNWLKCNKCKKIILYPEKVVDEQLKSRLIMTKRFNCEKCRANLSPVIVPPQSEKSEYINNIQQIWTRAFNEIQTAKKLIIIGYSMRETDFDLRTLIKLALKQSNINEIEIISNSLNSLNNYNSFFRGFKNIKYSTGGFSFFINEK